MTRSEQVLSRLRNAKGDWVDGPELANERVGGSEGLRRVRELRDEGYVIDERPHPDASRDIHQYRLREGRTARSLPVPGQQSAFFDSAPVRPVVPEKHYGTQLDPTWTIQLGLGFYDQHLRIYQAPFSHAGLETHIWVPSAELATVVGKTDWVEVVEGNGTTWQIPTKRLIDAGIGTINTLGRFLGAPAELWRKLDGKTIRNDTAPNLAAGEPR